MNHRNSNGRTMYDYTRASSVTTWRVVAERFARGAERRIESATNQRRLARRDREFRRRVRLASRRPRDRRRDALGAAVRSRGGASRATDRNRGEWTIEQARANEPHWQREPIITSAGLKIGPGASWLRGYKPARQSPAYRQCSAARTYN